jgi:hypothetical protein
MSIYRPAHSGKERASSRFLLRETNVVCRSGKKHNKKKEKKKGKKAGDGARHRPNATVYKKSVRPPKK